MMRCQLSRLEVDVPALEMPAMRRMYAIILNVALHLLESASCVASIIVKPLA